MMLYRVEMKKEIIRLIKLGNIRSGKSRSGRITFLRGWSCTHHTMEDRTTA